LKKVRNLSN